MKISSGFGNILKFEFLQNFASTLIAGISPAIVHNVEKYYALKKVHYLSSIENIDGDYLEFGVFTGSSFCHSIRCWRNLAKIAPNAIEIKFYGFDSFSGFGPLDDDDKHPFYVDGIFESNFEQVNARVKRVAGKFRFQLVRGFFTDTLKPGAASFGIEKSRVIFIDSDTYSSAHEALTFCAPTLQEGTFIVLDDFFSYKGSDNRGVKRAFSQFLFDHNITVRHVFTYGMGGVAYVISEPLQ